MALLDDIRKSEYLSLLGDKLQGLLDVPTSAARFMVNPTAVIDSLTGKTAMPKEVGFAEGASGLPQRENLTVLDPRNRAYMEGYQTGEPFSYAAMASPMVGAGATKLSDKLVQAITGNPMATGSKVIDYASMPFGNAIYLPNLPSKPNPLVGTRFEREYMGGLVDKTPVKIEDLKDASIMLMPWDSTSRNVKIKGISDEKLARDVITHGGQDYTRDIKHIEQGIGGASNLGIAKRIRDRDAQARLENLEAGGSGNVIALPTTMGAGAENFSVMPTEIFFGLLDSRSPSKAIIKDLDRSIREYKLPKGIGDKRVMTQPFKNFKGVMSEEGRMQLYTGEGLDSTAGELRKAFANRMGLKENQEYFKYNLEDLTNAITDPALLGVPKGYVGNTVLRTGMEGMHLRPSVNPTYSTDFTSQYLGSLGQSIPAEVLMPKTFAKLSELHKNKKADLRNMTLGSLEKRKEGFSEFIDDQVIDSYYNYINNQKKLGLLD
jgi:hypothetical protein